MHTYKKALHFYVYKKEERKRKENNNNKTLCGK